MYEYDPFGGSLGEDFDPVGNAEAAYRASIDPAQKEILRRMLEGIRETSKLSDSPNRSRLFSRMEKAGLILRFRVQGKHVAGLTPAGEALAREIFPPPAKAKRARKKAKP